MPNDYTLWDFQARSVAWLRSARDNGYGYACPSNVGLIGHEMGLGKTAIGLDAIKPLVQRGKKFIILAPGATIIQWQKNWDRWILDLEPDEFGMDGLFALRGSKTPIPPGVSVILSHTLLAKHEVVVKLIEANFDGILIDEIHKFGAEGTKRIKHLNALMNLTESKFETCRIGLSGTPVRNYAKEIYNIAHFLAPATFRNKEDFSRKYLTWDRKALWNPHQFHSDFAPFYLRYMTSEVMSGLPEIRRTKLYTEITDPFIRASYNKQVDLMSNYMNNAHKVDAFSLLGYLVKLRHITGIAKAKEPSIMEPMREYLAEGRKAVLGIHHHFVADRLQKSLREFPCTLIRGGMNDFEKENAKNSFIAAPAPAYCLLSIKAAGEGIDGLQYSGATKAYVFERQWNGRDEEQFEKRIHRPGQKEKCHIEYTIATGTVDEFYDDMVEYKRRITTQVEDADYESNPAFLKQLAEKVINNRLPDISYASVKEFGEDGEGE